MRSRRARPSARRPRTSSSRSRHERGGALELVARLIGGDARALLVAELAASAARAPALDSASAARRASISSISRSRRAIHCCDSSAAAAAARADLREPIALLGARGVRDAPLGERRLAAGERARRLADPRRERVELALELHALAAQLLEAQPERTASASSASASATHSDRSATRPSCASTVAFARSRARSRSFSWLATASAAVWWRLRRLSSSSAAQRGLALGRGVLRDEQPELLAERRDLLLELAELARAREQPSAAGCCRPRSTPSVPSTSPAAVTNVAGGRAPA
jgi:hypothetical protein